MLYFLANDVPAEKQVAVFLSAIGATTYTLLCHLLAPAKLQKKSLVELFSALKRHYNPQPLVIAERFYFQCKSQRSSESAFKFVAKLRKLGTSCKFGDFLNEALRDRFVCGLHSTII